MEVHANQEIRQALLAVFCFSACRPVFRSIYKNGRYGQGIPDNILFPGVCI